jgi:hypothetical protein
MHEENCVIGIGLQYLTTATRAQLKQASTREHVRHQGAVTVQIHSIPVVIARRCNCTDPVATAAPHGVNIAVCCDQTVLSQRATSDTANCSRLMLMKIISAMLSGKGSKSMIVETQTAEMPNELSRRERRLPCAAAERMRRHRQRR